MSRHQGAAFRKRPDTEAPVIHQPSAWLRSTAARRLRDVHRALGATVPPPGYGMVVSPLVDRPGHIDCQTWDRCCDRCHAFVPDDLHLGMYQPLPAVMLSLGLCGTCAGRENVR